MEVWKDIKGYEGYYQVSNLGRIKSLSKKVIGKLNSIRTLDEKILNPIKKDGYLRVALYNKKRKNHRVHRIVAITFIENKDNKPYINHKNGIKNDNRVQNLEWCTQKENVKHYWAKIKNHDNRKRVS